METLLTHYIGKYLTDFHPSYTNDALWDSDETNASHFGAKRSKVKVTVDLYVLETSVVLFCL